MAATDFWIVLKTGKHIHFKTRKEAESWVKANKDFPKGKYHIYNNDEKGYADMRNRGKYWR